MSTAEQLEGRAALTGYLEAAGLPRARVLADAEGWPLVPGKLGRVEWQGGEWDGSPSHLYVFTDHPVQVAKLLALPGVERHQMGQGEARLRFLAADAPTLRAVCGLIGARKRRPPTSGLSAEHMARIRPQH